jgi:hypothetical protein
VPFTKVRGLNWSFQNFKDEIDPLSTVQGRSCLFRLLFGWHPSSRSACDASPNLLCPCWLAGSPRTSRKQAAQHHVIPELPTTEPVNVCCLALAAMIRRQGARDKTGTESYKQRRCQAPTAVSQSERQESTRGSGHIFESGSSRANPSRRPASLATPKSTFSAGSGWLGAAVSLLMTVLMYD